MSIEGWPAADHSPRIVFSPMDGDPNPGVEIERKFLVDRLPDGLDVGERIEQGYLAVADDGVEVRIRRSGDTTTLTVKSGPGEVRTEEEIAIDGRRFESLWPLTDGRRVAKTRHRVPVMPGLTAEVDVYEGAHDGLLTAEVEFPTREASAGFDPPAWLGRELTGDRRYANQALAFHGPPPDR
jgi:CYTH domain-containing protein